MSILFYILAVIGLMVVIGSLVVLYGIWRAFGPWILAAAGAKCKHHKSRQAVRCDTGSTIYYICGGCLAGYHIDYESEEQLAEIKKDPFKYYQEHCDVK